MPATFTASIGGDDVALSTSAAVVVTASPTASRGEPEKIVIQNNHASAVVTVGGPNVADGSNGIVLPGGANNSVTLHLTNPGESVYAIADTGTPSVQVTRVG